MFGFFLGTGMAATAYGAFSVIGGFIKALFRHPILTMIVGGLIFMVSDCAERNNFGAIDAKQIMMASPATMNDVLGKQPGSCQNLVNGETCAYTDTGAVIYHGSTVSQFDFLKLRNERFDNSDRFYRRVLGMLSLPYRSPDVSTIDEIVWHYPGVGVITVTSNSDMNVESVKIGQSY